MADAQNGALEPRSADRESVGIEAQQQALLDAVVAMASNLELADVLDRIVKSACELTQARYAALGVLEPNVSAQPERPLAEFHYTGITAEEHRKIGRLPGGHGVLGVLIKDPRPLRLPEITDHPASVGFPPHHPPMHSFLGVPVRVRGAVFGNLYLSQKRSAPEFTEQDERTVIGLAAAAGVAIENARLFDDAQRRARWLTAAAETTTRVSSDLSRSPQVIAAAALEAGGCDDVLVALPVSTDEDEPVLVGGHVELRDLVVDGAAGPRAEQLLGRPLSDFEDLLGEIGDALVSVTDRDPFGGDDRAYATLVVPLRAAESRLGLLVLSRARPLDWTPGELLAIGAFANQLSLGMAHAQTEQNRRRLAVYSDRDRIARDLHDHVIQRIFAVGLGLQSVVRRLPDQKVAHRVSRYVGDLDATIADIRATIFSLHHEVGTESGSLRSDVLAVIADVSPALGFEPRVTLAGPIDSVIPTYLYDDVLAVVRESLSNVARHAKAREVTVLVGVDTASKTLRIRVEDDGVGIPDAVTPGGGLRNTESRAQAAGGHAEVTRRPDNDGTTFNWSVPLPL
ncbi:GAF domain-containing protein [Microlunatus panaciterrae]|uniref:Signal transduction histidine kinase n=1 Tax=Microlunatus panaciterrae TaxID=400768 RepID=A0ABS2RNP2_9ACTN|nr:GAF domain-containing protein [Microlunatus panaciterrae]MBM7800631.1 signal transduction histidine kinase [Microlunatus panaciterrae]